LFRGFLKKIKPKKWIQRFPLKVSKNWLLDFYHQLI
jgi:hypothetical protein